MTKLFQICRTFVKLLVLYCSISVILYILYISFRSLYKFSFIRLKNRQKKTRKNNLIKIQSQHFVYCWRQTNVCFVEGRLKLPSEQSQLLQAILCPYHFTAVLTLGSWLSAPGNTHCYKNAWNLLIPHHHLHYHGN